MLENAEQTTPAGGKLWCHGLMWRICPVGNLMAIFWLSLFNTPGPDTTPTGNPTDETTTETSEPHTVRSMSHLMVVSRVTGRLVRWDSCLCSLKCASRFTGLRAVGGWLASGGSGERADPESGTTPVS